MSLVEKSAKVRDEYVLILDRGYIDKNLSSPEARLSERYPLNATSAGASPIRACTHDIAFGDMFQRASEEDKVDMIYVGIL